MRFTTSTTLFLFSLITFTSATALPADDAASEFTKRATKRVRVCSGANFSGACIVYEPQHLACTNVARKHNDVVLSVRPEKGQRCRFFSEGGCKGISFLTQYPGVTDIKTSSSAAVRALDKKVTSFRCDHTV